jgi:ketosteroid isomerase-like protein
VTIASLSSQRKKDEEVSVLSAEDRSAIEALHRAWLDAELRGDSAALLDLCTSTPVWLPPNEPPLCGEAAIRQWLRDQPYTTLRRIEIDELTIAGSASFAWKLASFRTTLGGAAGEVVLVTGFHAWLLQRDAAGAWRIGVVAWALNSGVTAPR